MHQLLQIFDNEDLQEIAPFLLRKVGKINSMIASGEVSPEDVADDLFILAEEELG